MSPFQLLRRLLAAVTAGDRVLLFDSGGGGYSGPAIGHALDRF